MASPQAVFDGRLLVRKIIGVTTATLVVVVLVAGGETLLAGPLANAAVMFGFLGASFAAAIAAGYVLSRHLVADRP